MLSITSAPHLREEEHVADRALAREQHDEPVDADAEPTGGRHAVLQRGDEILVHPCHDDFGNIGAGFGFPVRFRIEVSDDAKFETGVVLLADRTANDFPNPGLTPFRVAKVGKSGRYLRVTASQLVLRSKDYIFAVAEVEVLDTDKRNLALRKPVTALDSIQAPVRWARKNLTDGIWAKTNDPAVSRQLVQLRKQREVILNRIHTPASRQRGKKLVAQVAEIRKQIDQLAPGQMVYAASTTFKVQGNFKPTQGKPRPIHVLARGNILQWQYGVHNWLDLP